jgi:autophagy-related protein 13
VPPMVHGTSVSTSSSPGKPISPHTPHTPAIPSRLSDNLTIDYTSGPRRSSSHRSRRRLPAEVTREENSSEGTAQEGTTAIDIPTSPRAWPYVRRSSSASGQLRERALEEEPDLYGLRSASLPVEERGDLSMSELLRENIREAGTADAPISPGEGDERSPDVETASSFRGAFPFPALETSQRTSREDSSLSRPSSVAETSGVPGIARGHQSRFSRRYGRASPSFSSDRSRYSGTGGTGSKGEEDELIFQLSELGSASRRSLEETAQRGGGSGSGSQRGDRRGGWNQ